MFGQRNLRTLVQQKKLELKIGINCIEQHELRISLSRVPSSEEVYEFKN